MKRAKIITAFLLVLMLCSVLFFSSCGEKDNNGDGPIDSPPLPMKLTTPTVVLTNDAATWSADASADKFEISLDGNLSYIENSVTSKKLTNGQTFKIRAIGDGTNYSNSDWSNSVTYVKTTPKYTVTWKNSDTVLETDTDVAEGAVPTYDGTQPTKAADAQYTYVFAGWTPEVVAATGDATYTAVFTSLINKYTVTWKSGDTVLETDENVEYGTVPVYNGATPTKASTAQYTYTFNGWTPQIDSVTKSVTYQAQFSETVKSYTVTFYSEDGASVLASVTVPYGTAAVYNGTIPSKNATAQYTYRFDKWVTEAGGTIQDTLANVVENRNVYAAFIPVIRTVDVHIVANHAAYGTVSVSVLEDIPYGSAIGVVENTVTIGDRVITAAAAAATAQYTYTFVDWTTAGSVGNDTIIMANFTRCVNCYTVTWKNGENVLEIDENVEYGAVPIYNNSIPTTPADLPSGYVFCGWTPAVSAVEGNVTYFAQFADGTNKHTVTFYDEDGVTVLGVAVVENGANAEYPNAAPAKAATVEFAYTFDQWVTAKGGITPAVLTNITADQAVYATYASSVRRYTVTFCDWNGTVLSEQMVAYGNGATAPEGLEIDGYRFNGWNKAYDNITEDIIVTAQYQAQVEVQFIDYDGSVIYSEYIDLGGDFTNVPAGPSRVDYKFTGWSTTVFTDIMEDLVVNAQYVRTYRVFFLDHDGTVLKSDNIVVGEKAQAPLEDPSREGYQFVGWDVDVSNITITSNLTVSAVYEINRYTVTFTDPSGKIIAVKENIKHGFPVIAPEPNDKYVHLGEDSGSYIYGKGYLFTGWDRPLDTITANQTITAVYGDEITDAIVAVRNVAIDLSESGVNRQVTLEVLLLNANNPYGISLDLQIDPVLLKSVPTVSVSGSQMADGSEYYESKLNSEGIYELRWTKNSGISNDTVVKFTFSINASETEGDYSVRVLDTTYIITNELQKLTPACVSGVVTVNH